MHGAARGRPWAVTDSIRNPHDHFLDCTCNTRNSILFTMKIAIPLTGGRLSEHFGHCEEFAVIEADPTSKQITSQAWLVPPPHEPGVLPRWLSAQGVQVVIAGGMGPRALNLFAEHGIAVHAGAAGGAPEDLARAFLDGASTGGKPTCGGHGRGHGCRG